MEIRGNYVETRGMLYIMHGTCLLSWFDNFCQEMWGNGMIHMASSLVLERIGHSSGPPSFSFRNELGYANVEL
jgi:hypothetical protein